LISSTRFEPEGSSSGRRLYVNVWYGTLYIHRNKQTSKYKSVFDTQNWSPISMHSLFGHFRALRDISSSSWPVCLTPCPRHQHEHATITMAKRLLERCIREWNGVIWC